MARTGRRGSQPWWMSSWFHAVSVACFSAWVWSRYGLLEFPVVDDQAYFVYLGQAVARGEPIYESTVMGYPPLGSLLAAGAIQVAGGWGVPSYLAPRFASLAIAMLSTGLLVCVTRRVTGSAWAGAVAGIVFSGFGLLASVIVSTLQPKLVLIASMLLACHAVQRRRWGLAGLASGLAATCWQPAALVGVALLPVCAWNGGRRRVRTSAVYALGGLAALIPSLAYLALTDAWQAFWYRMNAQAAAGLFEAAPLTRLVRAASNQYLDERYIFLAAAVGLTLYAIETLARPRHLRSAWLEPRSGGIALLSLGWLAYACLDFDFWPDMIPLCPLVAFWAVWGVHRMAGWIARGPLPARWRTLTARLAACAGLAALALYAVNDAFFYRAGLTLSEQLEIVDEIVAAAGEDGVVYATMSEEVYVLSERPAPVPFLRVSLARYSDPRAGVWGCKEIARWVAEEAPAVVVARESRREPRSCETFLVRQLVQRGYHQRVVEMSSPVLWGHFDPSESWTVLTRGSGASDLGSVSPGGA